MKKEIICRQQYPLSIAIDGEQLVVFNSIERRGGEIVRVLSDNGWVAHFIDEYVVRSVRDTEIEQYIDYLLADEDANEIKERMTVNLPKKAIELIYPIDRCKDEKLLCDKFIIILRSIVDSYLGHLI